MIPEEEALMEQVKKMVHVMGIEFLFQIMSQGLMAEDTMSCFTPEERSNIEAQYEKAHKALADSFKQPLLESQIDRRFEVGSDVVTIEVEAQSQAFPLDE